MYGVTSWGYGCADPSFPGVYADVPSRQSKNMLLFDTSWLSFSGVKSWIVDNTGGEC